MHQTTWCVHQAITKEDLRSDTFEACGVGAINHARELTLHNDGVLSYAYVLCSAVGYLLLLCPHQVVVVVDCKRLSKSQYPHDGGLVAADVEPLGPAS